MIFNSSAVSLRKTVARALTAERKLPVNLKKGDESIFKDKTSAAIEKVEVLHLENVTVVNKGVAFKWLHVVKELLLSNDKGYFVPYNWRDLLRIVLFWRSVRTRRDVSHILINNLYSHTYYHWLVEALPRLFLVKDQLPSSVLLFPEDHDRPFHVESLELFGVKEVETIRARSFYSVTHLVASTEIGKMANYHPEVLLRTASYIKQLSKGKANKGDRVYISRSKANARKVLNEETLIPLLQGLGFAIVNSEDYSFEDQVHLMSRCRYLVGAHGAGLTNMIFMQEGGAVLELCRDDRGENYFFYSLASAVKLKYFYQFCEPIGQGSVQSSDIVVDIDEFEKNMKWMLSE